MDRLRNKGDVLKETIEYPRVGELFRNRRRARGTRGHSPGRAP